MLVLRSSHWNARLILANAKNPSGFRSCSRLCMASCGITREMKDELLLTILVFGFLRFNPSLPLLTTVSRILLAPKAGALSDAPLGYRCEEAPSLEVSWDAVDSFSLSLIL